jgi:hypothetical protein
MKKFLLPFLFMGISFVGVSQTYSIVLDRIYHFKHPQEISTNDAIDLGKITSEGYHDVLMRFVLNLDKMVLIRKIEEREEISMPIVYKNKIGDCYNLVVKFGNEYVNYTFAEQSKDKYILELRYLKDDWIIGWFNDNLKVKKER